MSGITDEVAIETHDLIHDAELEEQRLHGTKSLTEEDPGPPERSDLGDAPHSDSKKAEHKGSTLDKVKEALHLKKSSKQNP
ncbi:hypothetical protein G7Z17_g861 [Cylindrodendrum hubeiense]|uniref:Uncharacterized protein n=1 Tax=Cylindrodendrum hubeiense TaxID=595255 RepID=A0A9P5HKI2_9HYPO|nr:hypothetical protein G7Z17_g861 [Cylindrodendrum hubeiense]